MSTTTTDGLPEPQASTANIIDALLTLHAERTRTHYGFTESWCPECHVDFPCRTVVLVRALPAGGKE